MFLYLRNFRNALPDADGRKGKVASTERRGKGKGFGAARNVLLCKKLPPPPQPARGWPRWKASLPP